MDRPLSLKISVSGVRGIIGESLTPQLVTSFAAAFGTYCGNGRIMIGTDTRSSRGMLTHAVVAGLLSVGCTPVKLGIVALPTLQLHTREARALGGICISASHNPMQWNALKFFDADGIILRPNQFSELLDLYHQGIYPRVDAHAIAQTNTDDSAQERHHKVVLGGVDVDAIRARKFKVVVDCCNGAASLSTPDFLRQMGCEVVDINTNLDAPFPREPEPLPQNIGELCEKVRQTGADLGFAQDADADRLALVSEKGVALGEDCTVALAVRHALRRTPGPVVVNVSTSRMIDDIAAKIQCPVHRTKVGEISVIEKMLECDARIGGEGTGGVIAPCLNPCRDSFVGMAYILEAMALEKMSLGEMRQRVPIYAVVKEKLGCRPRDVSPAVRRLRRFYRHEELDLTDGIKVIWPDRWMCVHGSNTEPVIRITAEAPTEPEARSLVRSVFEYLRGV